jgi:aminoglycoside phosphotransferase (APT) family kinase protein
MRAKRKPGREHFRKGAEINKQERRDIKQAKRTAKMNRSERAAEARKPTVVYKDTKQDYGTSRSYKEYNDGDLQKGFKPQDSKETRYTLKERLANRKEFKEEKRKLVRRAANNANKRRAENDAEYSRATGRDLMQGGGMIKRADGSYSKRGLWDNIRANKGSGKKPTKQMLKQEAKIKKDESKKKGA